MRPSLLLKYLVFYPNFIVGLQFKLSEIGVRIKSNI